jgi:uncharacterized protein
VLPGGDLNEATATFIQYADKDWSYTDCLSKVMMERLQVAEAFAFDNHFRQFGTVRVLPN